MGVKNKLSAEDKKNKRLAKWLMSLNRDQRMLLTEYCVAQSESDLQAYFNAYERVLRPALYKIFGDELEGEKAYSSIVYMIGLDAISMRNFKNGSVGYMKYIDEIKPNVTSEYTMRKANGEKEKDIIEAIWAKYPKVSKSAIRNIISEFKRDSKKINAADDVSVNDAVNYIFNEDNAETSKEKEVQKVEKEEVQETEESKVEEKPKFRVLSKKIIVDVEGEFATYHVENGVISINTNGNGTAYSSEEEVKHAFSEKLESYAKQLDREQSEMLEVMNMYK